MDPQELSAYELVQLCLNVNDEATWTEFVRRFNPLIAGVIVKRLRRHTGNIPNPSLIDDLTQDTYVKLCSNNFKPLRMFDFQHENAFFGFLKVVATNVAEDYLRSTRSQKRGQGRDDADFDEIGPAGPSTSAEPMEQKILMDEINRCLQGHSSDPNFARDFAIFWLYYRQGLTAKAISELPSIRLEVKGVESVLFRLTRIVRDKLGRSAGQKRASGR